MDEVNDSMTRLSVYTVATYLDDRYLIDPQSDC